MPLQLYENSSYMSSEYIFPVAQSSTLKILYQHFWTRDFGDLIRKAQMVEIKAKTSILSTLIRLLCFIFSKLFNSPY